MFQHLESLPQDPILSLMNQFKADPRQDKIDLGIGVYKDDHGQTPVMSAVKKAEQLLIDQEKTKSYIGSAGNAVFNQRMAELLFGENSTLLNGERLAQAQTPGGCGALRMAAEFLKQSNSEAVIWVSNPTWGNHIPLLSGAGLTIKKYSYYDSSQNGVNFESMISDLQQAKAGDIVLLHGCCHNPSGADLTLEQWHHVTELVNEKGLVPFVDIAYQGLGDGLEQDAQGLRILAESVPEMVIAASCSKNFGLYRERTGTLIIVAASSANADNCRSQLFSLIRGHYSMPPSHGAAVVEHILSSPELKAEWSTELALMTQRIQQLRNLFSDEMAKLDEDFSFVTRQKGMFSFLGLSPDQVNTLKQKNGIYMIDSSRINIAGLNQANASHIAAAVKDCLSR